MNRFFTIAAAAALTFSGMLTASEDIADLQARLATLEAKMMAPAASGDAESLMSLQKKGNIKIGGKVEVNLFTKHRDEVSISNNAKVRAAQAATGFIFPTNTDDQFNYTTYNWEGSLNFQVDINADTKAVINLDLENGDWNGQSGDLVDEIYLEFNKVRGSNWDVIVGKKLMPFGQAYEPNISDMYVDGDGLVMNDYSTTDTGNRNSGNTHTQVGLNNYGAGYPLGFTGIDSAPEAVGVIGKYSYKDMLTFEAASFMSGSEGVGQAENMHNDKSDKWFGDYAMRLTYTPTEALTTSISFMNQHEDWEARFAWRPASQQQQGVDARSLSLAFTYDAKAINTLFFGEYVANWNVGHSLNQADVFQLGATYALTPKIALTGWYEMMAVDNLSSTKGRYPLNDPTFNALKQGEVNEDAQRFGMAAGYTTDSGVQFNVEYIYELYQNNLNWYQDVDCHQLAFQTVYTF